MEKSNNYSAYFQFRVRVIYLGQFEKLDIIHSYGILLDKYRKNYFE